MKRTLVGLIAFLIIMFPLRIYAEEWSELTGLLDDSLQLVKRNEDEKAVQVLQHFSEQFVIKGNEKKQEVTPDQVRVISLAYDKAKQSLAEEEVSKQVKIDNVLALQLAVDAQVSKYQPLWMEREGKVMDAFSQMEKAMTKEDTGQFQQTLNTFLHEFNIIYPSLMIALPENEVQRVNAHLSYLDEFRNVMLKTKGGQMQVGIIKGDLQKIFHTVKKDEIAPSLIWFMTITGGLILFTLTYVGWSISLAYDKAKQSLAEEEVSKQVKIDNVLALQLAVDAQVSKYQPLWMEREGKVMDAFSQMEKAMTKEDTGQFQQTLNTFLHEFNIIYPSLMIALPENEVQRVNAHLSYLDEFRNVMLKTKGGQMQVGIIKGDLQKIFHTVKKDEIAPSLIWFMTITGGLILFTLTYVGWRKYKGEREKRKSNVHSKNR